MNEPIEQPTCRNCGAPGNLKLGWTGAQYCSEQCERKSISQLHNSMPGAGPVPYVGWVPNQISIEISNRWKKP